MNIREIKKMARAYIEENLSSLEDYGAKNDDGETILSALLGSLINPSGKYYMPWACSNVDPCPRCKGTGARKKDEPCSRCEGTGERTLGSFKCSSEEPNEQVLDRLLKNGVEPIPNTVTLFKCNVCNGSGKVHPPCSYCGGVGSREAHEDEMFWEFMDEFANKHDCWIESGEGDPCDTFLCKVKSE